MFYKQKVEFKKKQQPVADEQDGAAVETSDDQSIILQITDPEQKDPSEWNVYPLSSTQVYLAISPVCELVLGLIMQSVSHHVCICE